MRTMRALEVTLGALALALLGGAGGLALCHSIRVADVADPSAKSQSPRAEAGSHPILSGQQTVVRQNRRDQDQRSASGDGFVLSGGWPWPRPGNAWNVQYAPEPPAADDGPIGVSAPQPNPPRLLQGDFWTAEERKRFFGDRN